mmetsp:Transcript_1108/g.1811  ORF Transcript_1108/g.1811 Transcript_1108/m.1811 type:complete len:779 (-) Transcript_1108:3118-5454(-)|eukprot:CAMPEP_0203749918 /NCGR_PEP_ID=MMETSP0098-20131031/4280_1 /ASSEMBLY_ACC=CAM_ASM_000208 /TAXON_ID=96639 /ORGANISM=" , Strain NY0313808BC1" /LENGTH=778 /DNA_ID=CAMNT_0050639037 /DNA_START=232 /DNA_END=2568 /DNA_ORIENTATION=+
MELVNGKIANGEILQTDSMRANSNAIGVFTSGGDAPGMNAVVRAVVRLGIHYGRDVFAIYEGYQGLVDGGDLIKKMNWQSVSMMMHKGGTIIGSARCKDFRERWGRLQGCKNLIKKNITNLICCGGDGSLTGANLFRSEWSGLVAELLDKGEISDEEAERCSYLNLVGCVGSIDNDMVYDGTLTIGTDTALHRIVETIDAVQSTASSHQRTFVCELMGRHCGYLAWAAGMATAADYIFIPESPPKYDNWEDVLCEKLDTRRKEGARLCTVLVAEGAIDKYGKPITTDYVHKVIVERLGHDCRKTILGHVQRGGTTSAYDRILSTVSGAMAVEKILRAKKGDPATIVGVKGFNPTFNPLMESVVATQKVAEYTKELNFEKAIQARMKDFAQHFEYHKSINRDVAKCPRMNEKKTLGIMCSGAPAGGMNAAIRAAGHYAMNLGYSVLIIRGGFVGLKKGAVEPLGWMECSGWSSDGGCKIQTDRETPSDSEGIMESLREFGIDALCVIGGFDALRGLYEMGDELNVPIAYLPATISNNVPGTDFSIGSDTAANAITAAIDTCKKSADASSHRVFIIETQGRNTGYLALCGAIAAGADIVYTPEEGVTLAQMQKDIERIKNHITSKGHKRHFVIVRNEHCSSGYDLDFMKRLFSVEGTGYYTVRTVQLGHLCQGDTPSPLDRIRATLLGANSVEFLIDQIEKKRVEKVLVGQVHNHITQTPIVEIGKFCVWDSRIPLNRQWAWVLALFKHLAGYGKTNLEESYTEEVDMYCKNKHVNSNFE